MTIHWDFGLYDPKESCKVSPYCFHPKKSTLRSKCGASPSGYCTCNKEQMFVAKESMSSNFSPLGRPNHGVPTIRELLPWLGIFMRTDSHGKMIPMSGIL
jgi:hypothetical protein